MPKWAAHTYNADNMTDMAGTSLLAHRAIQPKIAPMQQAVLNCLYEWRTNAEIAEHLHLPINCITGRTKELRDLRLVTRAEVRKCKVTGHLATAWRITTAEERQVTEYQPRFFGA